jgi:hypothetical protein
MNTELLFGSEAERRELVAQVTQRADETTEDHLLPISPITITITLSIYIHC